MSERPLVSVVTATRARHADIVLAIHQVRNQTYRPLEHVIVSDGPDPELDALITGMMFDQVEPTPSGKLIPDERVVPIVFAETGRCWSDELAYSPGAAPFLVAQLMAHGPLQMWLSDDEVMILEHVELLVDLLELGRHDFVYSRAECWDAADPSNTWTIGEFPPTPDQITNALYRTALLDYGTFQPHVGRGTDWHQISRWIAAGASYGMLNQVTFRHRADQLGGVHAGPRYRQPLRGLGDRGSYAGPRWRGQVPVDDDGRQLPQLAPGASR